MKVSLVIPVYYNEGKLHPLQEDLKEKFINKIDYDYEIVMVNDGSGDNSWQVMQEIAAMDSHVKIYSLSRNFGSHAACLCGLSRSVDLHLKLTQGGCELLLLSPEFCPHPQWVNST